MKVKVEFIEMIWDNYQGASGKPIKRSVLMEISDATPILQVEDRVVGTLTNNGIRSTYDPSDAGYHPGGVLSITILPTLKN